MKQSQFLLFLFILALVITGGQHALAQKKAVPPKATNEYEAIDKKALLLPDSLTATTSGIAWYVNSNFKSGKEKARAVFIWIATNIQYDIENMYAINFYEPEDNKILRPLKTRKGICENYAALFKDICSKSGITSYVIEGYTKQNGIADYIPHAWNAALIDSSWYLFDATWGSGYVSGGKYVRKINNDCFMVIPSKFIESHMPFDYLWQFLHYPVSNQEFYEGRTREDTSKPFFNYADSIKAYEKLGHIDQAISSSRRIEKNGVKNSMIFDRLQHLKVEIENSRLSGIADLFNAAAADFNEGVNYYNDFINYRNKQFTPMRSDPEIQDMLDAVSEKLKSSLALLSQIKNPDVNTRTMMTQLAKSILDASSQVREQQQWLNMYFSKSKSGRKSMFYEKKTTLFGIPVN